jgi:RNA polymerase sigma-70 factor (ECF subfamily)
MNTEKEMLQADSAETLMVLISNGSAPAFEELYFRFAQKIFSYFFRMLWKNKELAEDLTQELFLKIIKNAGSFNPDKRFITWFYSIANNMCKNEYRKAETQMKYKPDTDPVAFGNMETNTDRKRFKEAVAAYTTQLPEEKKALYILRFEEQLSVPDISAILNINEGTVKSRIFYLLKDMKEQLSPFKNLLIYP